MSIVRIKTFKIGKRIFYVFILFVMSVPHVYSQAGADKTSFLNAYKEICNWLTVTDSYSFQLKYVSYLDHTSKIPFESESGYYKKAGKNFISEVMGVLTIQNENVKLLLDSGSRVMTLSKPQPASLTSIDPKQLETLIGNCKSVTKTGTSHGTTYKMFFPANSMLEAYELRVNKEGIITQLTYYYSEQVEKDYDDDIQGVEKKVKPRLEIYFLNIKTGIRMENSEYSELNYITINQSKPKPTQKYYNYSIKDYRFSSQ